MPLRILTVGSLYPPQHLGGYELVWQAAVGALRSAGHDVRVLCVRDRLGGGDPVDEPGVHRELGWYWREHAFPSLTARARLELERRNRTILLRHLEEHRTDVVSWWSMGGMSMSLVEHVRRRGRPAIGWVNDDWLVYGPRVDQWMASWSGPRRPLRPLVEALTRVPAAVRFDDAARWVFCSAAIEGTARRVHPGLRDTAFLHQGVAADFRPVPDRPWRGELLYAGRIDERKGIATAIDAVTGLPGVSLRVVGDGDPAVATALQERARHQGAPVTFEPAVPRGELARRYAACDAVVFPVEWFEPWGLVPLEAMATGRPVVATGRGGSAEYLEDGVNALLFEAGDAESLRGAVQRLAGDPGLRARLRAGGLRTAARLTEARWASAVVAEHEGLPQTVTAASRRLRR